MPGFKFKESGVMSAFDEASNGNQQGGENLQSQGAAKLAAFFEEGNSPEESSSFSKGELEQVSFLFKEDNGSLVFDSGDDSTVSFVDAAGCDFYEPQETECGEDNKEDTRKDSEECSQTNGFKFIFKKPTVMQSISDTAKYKLLSKKFENGRLVLLVDTESGGKPEPLMYLLQSAKELMAFRLLAPALDVVIPGEVCGYPVRYVHPSFLRGSLNPLTGLKYQNLINNFAAENIITLNKEKIKDAAKGAKSLALPNGLVALPPNLFNYCLALKSITIPASVTSVSVNAFSYSNLKDIWFNGVCPDGFLNNVYLPAGVKIHVKPEFLDSFRR